MLMGPDKVTRSVRRPLEARMRSVAYAAMAYWYYEWDWGEAIAFDGIDQAADILDSEHLRTFVDSGVQRWASLAPEASLTNRMGPVVSAVRRLRSGSDTWDHLEVPINAFCEAVSNVARSERGAFLLDAPSSMVFVDTLYAEPLALAEVGTQFGSKAFQASAVELSLGHIWHLQDRTTGLFRHFCDTTTELSPDIAWGRGNGWAMLGLAETIAVLQTTQVRGLAEVRESFRIACEGALRVQAPGGAWRNVLDDSASAVESSASAMIATALLIGIRSGELEAGRYFPAVSAAWTALAHSVDAGGHFIGVSFRPGLNRDASRYEHVPFAGNYPWGQGAYLRFAAEWLWHEGRSG